MTGSPHETEQRALEQSRAELTWLGLVWHHFIEWRVSKRPPAWDGSDYEDFTRGELVQRCLFLQRCLRHYAVSSDVALYWVLPLAVFAGAVLGMLVRGR